MSARALLPLIILSVLLGPVGSAMSAGGAAPIVEGPSSSRQAAPNTPIIKPPIIKPPRSGPQKEAPDTKPKKDPLPSCTVIIAHCLADCYRTYGGSASNNFFPRGAQRCEDACNSISPEGAKCKK
jgi:hypothetical protein